MIKIYCKRYGVYYRTNNHVQWRFATWAGFYDDIDEAIKRIWEHEPNAEKFQMLIQNTDTCKDELRTVTK